MKLLYFLSCVFILFLSSCYKKTEVAGYVYSKYGYPVANAEIAVIHGTPNGTSKMIPTTTNVSGYYHFIYRQEKKYVYKMNCKSDSGQAGEAVPIQYQKTNSINLYITTR